jgi:hypothetical protein
MNTTTSLSHPLRRAVCAATLLLLLGAGGCASAPPNNEPAANPRVVERDLGDNRALERAAALRPQR